MDKFKTSQILFLSLLLLSPLVISSSSEDINGREDKQSTNSKKQNPNAAERAIGILPPVAPWITITSWFKYAWMNLRPPDSQPIDKEGSESSGGKVKEAISKSFEGTKETAEKTAKVAGDVIHKTAEKVIKKTVSGNKIKSSSSSTDKDL